MSTIVITGGSSGIGAAAARELARRGHDLVVVGRNRERTRAVAAECGGTALLADFDRLDEVRGLADELARLPRIDVLANNAGGLVHRREVTVDGFERTLQLNHLAPYLLTRLLLPRLTASGARVLHTASVANLIAWRRFEDLDWTGRRWAGGWRAYGTSKLVTILFARELAQRTGLGSYAFHPGYVRTSFGAESPILRRFTNLVESAQIPPESGAAPLVQLATADEVPGENGGYFSQLRPDGRAQRRAKDPELAGRVWERSAELLGMPA